MKSSLILILLLCSCQSSYQSIDLLAKDHSWSRSNYGSSADINFATNSLILDMGDPINGVTWTQELPSKTSYEIKFEAKRLIGNDFFCALTFPVNTDYCSLIIDGWGSTVTGLSSINNLDASENETTLNLDIENQRWYKIKLRVYEQFVTVKVDDKTIIKLNTKGKKLSIRPEVYPSIPLGLASFYTSAEYRDFTYTQLK
ncbi:hypothetical protein PQO03_10325 [Lentisphaera profundi]|uniref:3-keto-disaccharide hydrolase domain-containing protein n=1 Tax=Lentisphaera profundi TaxID=1658616 RepID=A0ABY7VQW9_9BACT|nr:hypothetical protein [Lentisphaera profundi]WDE96109.1 hypothetical protein PQO03_10325 [Lentisphaera profundi]